MDPSHRAPVAEGTPGPVPVLPVGLVLLSLVLLPLLLAACVPQARAGSLPPTLTMRSTGGGSVALQDGIPVPSFGLQPRPRLDLAGPWRSQRATLDDDLSLTDRAASLAAITADAAGRETPGFDDSGWATVSVPDVIARPPDASGGGAWYRLAFFIPPDWQGRPLTLKFGAVNYLADVWLNGRWLGYHEGGYTPFAFAVEAVARPGQANLLAVRVDAPAWGSRNDIVPWGLADWWDYGGITRPVWLEASQPLGAVRADVVPHLDGGDVSVVVQDRGPAPVGGTVDIDVQPAVVDATDLLDPDPRHLIAPFAPSVASRRLAVGQLPPGGIAVLQASFSIEGAAEWRLDDPALYVLHVTVRADDGRTDELYETFGLRHIAVDPDAPRLLLDGRPTAFAGVALHDERIEPAAGGRPATAGPIVSAAQALDQLQRARQVAATLVRTGHTPADPRLLMLADRLGVAVWEEIPLYHFTPLTFGIAMGRGIPQQMLREMALRDMDHPAVLFYGLANESTGGQERADALARLRQVARDIDGTRLVGQACYGFDPADPTNDALDVVGFTFYHGVFYGTDPVSGTRDALIAAHQRYPRKPIMILEFGRWADPPDGPAAQVRIVEQAGHQLAVRSTTRAGGYVAAMVWWALDDYFTMRPGIALERFGLFAPDGRPRPVAAALAHLYGATEDAGALPTAAPPVGETVSGGTAVVPRAEGTSRLLGYLAYAVGTCVAILGGLLALSLALGGSSRAGRPGRRSGGSAR
ncbi:MAG TPA: glycoside hydrolase family 2 TIM barrel-domain containing protein [Candidatus Limnocylindrales bacterium]